MEKKRNKFANFFGLKKSDNKAIVDKSVRSDIRQNQQAGQTLILLGSLQNCTDSFFQIYNFTNKNWSPPQKVAGYHNLNFQSSTLKDRLYCMCEDRGRYNLKMFNPSATQAIVSLRYSFIIFEWCTMCACNQFLYFCGGNLTPTDQVLRYDPEVNSFDLLPPMNTKRFAAAAVYYGGCLYVLGGSDGPQIINSVERYNPDSKQWTTLPPMREKRFFHAVAVLNNKLYACGGHPTNSVEVYDPANNSWELVASMNKVRSHYWVVAHDGMLWAIGGDDDGRTIEAYDPSRNLWQIQHEMSAGIQLSYISTCWYTRVN